MAQSIRSDQLRHRQLDISHGCQDHTVLPYATPVFVKRLRRYQVKVRRSFSEGGSVVRLRAVVRSRQNRPANTLHADAAASTASHPASVTTRDPPLVRDETAELIVLIWGGREGNCFFGRDWTGQIALNWLGKLVFWSSVLECRRMIWRCQGRRKIASASPGMSIASRLAGLWVRMLWNTLAVSQLTLFLPISYQLSN